MGPYRITEHPVLPIPKKKEVVFTWNDQSLTGLAGEMISSALIAHGIHIFGHHPKDHSAQGIFCANGQCSQCLVIADGLPVKACMTPVTADIIVQSVEGLPQLPLAAAAASLEPIATTQVEVLIIGGGPAGLAAAIELGRLNVPTLLIDDKDHPGGKLVLQTHKFFGSQSDSYAGTRGYEIGRILAEQVAALPSVTVWLNSTAVGVFADQKVGVVQENSYQLIAPQKLLVATGAREKMLAFPGNTLPGVYGAGAFQTLVNRDLVKSSQRVLIVGGGNVGLIAGYHALQAGIEVAVLIEGMPEIGGYKVHADKLQRLGVPILTRHTIVAAHGKEHVKSVTIARLDDNWQVIDGTHRTYAVDTVLIAVGLAEVNEFYLKARQFGMDVFTAGDAQEIAEASAAMFTGRMAGHRIAQALGLPVGAMSADWEKKAQILKSKPGRPEQRPLPAAEEGVLPIFHCSQEVPCNPCTTVCPQNAVHTEDDRLTGLPWRDENQTCTGCLNCVAVCPGLAITLIDFRKDAEHPLVTLPYEIGRQAVAKGQLIGITDVDGSLLAQVPVVNIRQKKNYPRTLLVQVRLEKAIAKQAVGIRIQTQTIEPLELYTKAPLPDEAIICRCERITAGEIRAAIHNGVRDMNQLKALNRAGMGSCGSKTCRPMIRRLFQEEGVALADVTDRVDRPLFVEVPMGLFAGVKTGIKKG
jgi:sarcosine oxidase, subunit alpha